MIDRSQPVSFRFNGRRYRGLAGDTLASALLANGVATIARSVRLGRPRGLIAAGREEPNGLVVCRQGRHFGPPLAATLVPLRDGLEARSIVRRPGGRWPGARLRALAPAGSSFKSFVGGAGWRLLALVYRRLVPSLRGGSAEVATHERAEAECDVLVVGGGVAGLAAALAATEAGGRVILCEALARPGGLADIDDGTIDGMAQYDWARDAARRLAAQPRATVLTRTTCADHAGDHAWLVEERPEPAEGAGAAARLRLWRVRAGRIVLATGAIERPLVFRGNDRPGVMLASAARAYLDRYGVAPGRRGVLFTNNDDAYQTALALHESGLAEIRIVDTRSQPGGTPVMRCMAAGIRLTLASYVTDIETTDGGRRITGAHISALGFADIKTAHQLIECDFVCMSGGWSPSAADMAAQEEGKEGPRATGAAAGINGLDALLADARAAGASAAGAAPASTGRAGDAARETKPARAVMPAGGPGGKAADANRRFVDFAADVTAADVALALREGYRALVQIQTYTRLGLGLDRGATSLANADEMRRVALGEPQGLPEGSGQPLAPLQLGLAAGMAPPAAEKPGTAAILAQRCRDWTVAGGWRLARAYRPVGEPLEAAARREAEAALRALAAVDLSARGLIEITGSDAETFLERTATAEVRSLKSGEWSATLLLADNGSVIDAGAVERRGAGNLALVTGIANSAAVIAWLDGLRAARWPRLDVKIHDRTAGTARIGLFGPGKDEALARLRGDITGAAGSLARSLHEGIILGRSGRLAASSLLPGGVEIVLDADRTGTLWAALLAAGAGTVPMGQEALQRLRLERGLFDAHLVRDPRVTAAELGLIGPERIKPGEFVGKPALAAALATPRGRLRLVGLEREGEEEGDFLAGAAVCERPAREVPLGYVLAAGESPTLGRPVALALVTDGADRLDTAVYLPTPRGVLRARVVAPAFTGAEGDD